MSSSSVATAPISVIQGLNTYTIRRKVLKLFGAGFHVYDSTGKVVAYSNQKAFKLREDIRIYSDESMTTELLMIKSQKIIDFSSAYGVLDPHESRPVGIARRKGWTSLVRDSWELLDGSGQLIARLAEDSVLLALARRFLSNLIPQKFILRSNDGREQAVLRVHFNPFIYRLSVTLDPACSIDRRLVLAAGVLIAAIEGRQQN